MQINELKIQVSRIASQESIQRALLDSIMLVEEEAKDLCPTGKGDLQRSIKFEINGNTARVYTNKEYAPYVEYGTGLYAVAGNGRKDVPWRYQTPDGKWHTTSGMKAQPFLGPALYNKKAEILNIIKQEVTK